MNTISISEELFELAQQMKDALRKLESAVQAHDKHEIHTQNHFNKKFSVLLGFMADLLVVFRRLDVQSKEVQEVEREARKHWDHTKSGKLCGMHQELMQRSSKLSEENKVDLKSVYIFGKIFFDQYVEYVEYIFQAERRGLSIKTRKQHYSISSLHYSLRDYTGTDVLVILMKEKIFPRLHALYVYVVEYRDTHIMHPGLDTWSDTWTLSNTDGSTRFLTSRPSSTPLELAYVIRNFLKDSTDFLYDNLDAILAGWKLPVGSSLPLRSQEK